MDPSRDGDQYDGLRAGQNPNGVADKNDPYKRVELWNFKYSSADKRITRECNDEAFWFRSLPLMIPACGLTHWAVKTGRLTAHPKYGSFFKVVWSGVFAHLIGKMTYNAECNRRFRADPNSMLGREMRKSLGAPLLEPTDQDAIEIIAAQTGSLKPGTGTDGGLVVASEPSGAFGAYDSLRRRNRTNPSTQDSSEERVPFNDVPPPLREDKEIKMEASTRTEIPNEARPMNKRMPMPKTNKYGDILED